MHYLSDILYDRITVTTCIVLVCEQSVPMLLFRQVDLPTIVNIATCGLTSKVL